MRTEADTVNARNRAAMLSFVALILLLGISAWLSLDRARTSQGFGAALTVATE